MKDPGAIALEYLRKGWGSRASVLRSVLDYFDVRLPESTVKYICLALDPFHAVSASFYTDEGKYGITVCGALSGALASFNLVIHSPDELPYKFWTEGMSEGGWVRRLIDEGYPKEEKINVYLSMCEKYGYGAHYEMVKRFYRRFGTTDCFDIERPFKDPVSYECFKNCAKVVIWTANMAVDVINEYRRNPSAFKIGPENVKRLFLKI